jgi:type I restriction enzyme S subunit
VSGWRKVRLAEVAKVGAGNSAPQNKALFESGTYPFFRTADVGRVKVGELDTAQDYLNERGIKGLKLHPAGTVLIPKSGASTFLDHRVMMTVDGYVSSHLATLYANEDLLDHRFLFWFMQTISARDVSTDTSYPTLSLAQINAIQIPLPPLEQQRRIVATLNETFAAITTATANAEKNLANAREMFELERDAIVTGHGREWIEGPLGEVCHTQYGISGSMNSDGKGYKIFRMGEVQDGQLVDTGAMKFIDIAEPEFEPYRLRKGDVLFNRTNSIALVGKTGIFSLDGPYCFASYLIRVNFDPARISSRFACYMMNSRSFLERVRSKAAQSVNQANINATILRNERVCYPRSVAEQESLAAKLDQLQEQSDNLAEVYGTKLAHLAALKQALLDRIFSGEPIGTQLLAA